MQSTVVILILTACAVYVVWRLWYNLRDKDKPPCCAGCPLSGDCHKEQCGDGHCHEGHGGLHKDK